MTATMSRRPMLAAACVAVALLAIAASQARGQTIIDRWTTVAVPPPPALQSVTVDGAHAALLILDMYAATCVEAQRPACPGTVPRIERLLRDARAHRMLVIYTEGPATAAPRPPDGLAALAGEAVVKAGADKFLGSDLEKMLIAAGVKTVIVVGTSAQGAVLYTASGAAQRGLATIVPVDAYSSETAFAELYTAWHLKNAPATVSSHVTLTRTDLISIQ